MTFLNYIRSRFTKVLSVDTEFLMDSTGTIRKKVICFVYTDIFTGEVTPKWENDVGYSDRHFNYDECSIRTHIEIDNFKKISVNQYEEVIHYLFTMDALDREKV